MSYPLLSLPELQLVSTHKHDIQFFHTSQFQLILSLLAVNVISLGLASLSSGLFIIVHNVSRSVSSLFFLPAKGFKTLVSVKLVNRAQTLFSLEKPNLYSVFSCVSKHLVSKKPFHSIHTYKRGYILAVAWTNIESTTISKY